MNTNKKYKTLKERTYLLLDKMEENYGPHRIRRIDKEERNKMSLLFGIERNEREKFHQILDEEIIKRYKK